MTNENPKLPDGFDLALTIAQAKAWIPAPGDILTGTVLAVVKRTSSWGVYPAVAILPKDGALHDTVLIHAFHQVILSQLKEIRAQRGTVLTIAYLGKIETKEGNEYHHYVAVKGDDASKLLEQWSWDDDRPNIEDPPF